MLWNDCQILFSETNDDKCFRENAVGSFFFLQKYAKIVPQCAENLQNKGLSGGIHVPSVEIWAQTLTPPHFWQRMWPNPYEYMPRRIRGHKAWTFRMKIEYCNKQ